MAAAAWWLGLGGGLGGLGRGSGDLGVLQLHAGLTVKDRAAVGERGGLVGLLAQLALQQTQSVL